MEVHMPVQARAEPVNEADCADVQGRLVRICRTGAVVLQALRYSRRKMRSTMLSTDPSRCMK